MKFNYSNRLLRSAEPEALGGNGPAAPAANIIPLPEPALPSAALAAEPAPAAPAAEATAEPTFLQSVLGTVQTKGKLVSERDAAIARATTAEASLTAAHAELATLRAENAAFKQERETIQAALIAAQAANQEVEVAAASQVAALGFEPAALPAATSAPEETKDQLIARLEKETDNNKRHALAARINAMN